MRMARGAAGKLITAGKLAPTRENFPALLFALDADSVTPGNYNAGGKAVCHVTGASFPALSSGVGEYGKSGDLFWYSQHYNQQASNMDYLPDAWEDKNLLGLWVGINWNDLHYLGLSGDDSPVIAVCSTGDGDASVVLNNSNSVNAALLTNTQSTTLCVATAFDRGASSDAESLIAYSSDGTTMQISGLGADTGATDIRSAVFDVPRAYLNLDNGDVTSGNLYGFYLFGFSNANRKYMNSTHLVPLLNWMARNPTKGLHPFLSGIT